MRFQSPSRESKSKVSSFCIARTVALLWGIGLGVSSWILLSQHSQVVANFDLGAHPGIHFPSAPSVTTRKTYQEEEDDETPEQHAQRQKAARENQAWLVRKFQMGGNKFPGIEGDTQYRAPVVQEQQSEGRRPYLPSWLTGGANKRARGRENGKLDQEEQPPPQYIDPQCEHFNHTIMRPTHGCQVNTDTFLVYCNFENLRIDVTKITSDRGGEPLESVMGRDEGPEFPVYEKGAFSSNIRPMFDVPNEFRGNLHYMENVLNNMKYPTTTKKKKKNKPMMDMSCVETWSGTTLFLTRYEYVNLYHTMTDWWNAYFVMPPNDRTNVRVVFLDAHAQGNLDPVWKQIFGKVTYVQHLPDGGVCFEKAVFVPPGYLSPLFPDMATSRLHCPLCRLAEEFSDHVLQSFGLQNVQRIPGKIVVIDRKPYVSHPRSKPASMGRVLLNLEELKRRLLKVKHVTSVELVQLETMTFREQLATIREAHILIGNHGAGLSHVLFMDQRSHLLEFSEDYKEFFIYLSEWKGVQHTPIPLVESSRLSQSELAGTISTVESILGE